ncbi:MAG TPA: zinc metalloprotease HtpX [Sedimentisphaerales bacterium]|nr:zinc metalloprotease HtpX [Sedimentisphaerales bacterium]
MQRFLNNFKTTVLMGALMGLCMLIGYAIGGPEAMFPALMIGAVMNFFAFFFSDKIALATMRASPVHRKDDPELYDIVESLAGKAGLPMPRVYISPASAPNAFATGRNPSHSAVCVTAGLRRMLSRDELAGVIAHELAHIKNRDILISTIAAVVAGAISWFGYMMMFSGGRDRRGGHPLLFLLIMILAPLAAALIRMAISRSREYEADRMGASLIHSGRPLASALQKLENGSRQIPLPIPDAQSNMFIVAPLTGSNMARLFMTHPPVKDRVARLLKSVPAV